MRFDLDYKNKKTSKSTGLYAMSEIHQSSIAIATFMQRYIRTFVSTSSIQIHLNLLAHTRALRIVIRKHQRQSKPWEKCPNNVLHVVIRYSGPSHVGYKCSSSTVRVFSRYERHSMSVTTALCSSFLNFWAQPPNRPIFFGKISRLQSKMWMFIEVNYC
jgi:hypothetical protein